MGVHVEPDVPLMAAGLDLLGVVELRNAITAIFGVGLPATAALDLPTLDAMAARLAASLASSSGAQPPSQSGAGV